MNSKILLAALTIAGFTSCSTAYKSGQTPDDVYYSPVKVIEQKQEEQQEEEQQKAEEETAQDREIRRRIRDRRWRNDNDDNYNYNYNCNCYCNQYGYGYYNHPYYNPVPYYKPKAAIITAPRMVSLGGYGTGGNNTVVNPKTGAVSSNPGKVYNNSNKGNGLGNLIRQVISPNSNSNNSNNSNNTNTNNNSNNSRTYQPSSTPSSSGSSSGGSSGGSVSRPGRGGK